jgi:phage-related protein
MAGSFIQGWHQLQDAFGSIGKALAQIPWGTLLHALEQVGSELDQVFLAAWKSLQPALAPVGAAFSQLGKMMGGEFLGALKIVGVILGGIILLAISAILGAIVGLAQGLATFIGGIAKIIGGIVQIFSGVIQIISGIVAFIVDLCTGHFNKLGADLGVIWNGIKTMFSGVWNVIQGLFQATVGTLVAIISGFVGAIVKFFISLGDSMGLHVSGMINGVINWFQQLPGRAMAFVHNLVSGITTTLGGLGAKALIWAGDMINQFVAGIENGIGKVGDAVQKIAGKIASFLHFSKPDVGPLVDVDNWMPDFGDKLTKGLQDQIPKLEAASRGIAQTLANVAAPNPATLPQGPNAGAMMGNEQVVRYLQQIAQNSQRQQVSPPTSANLGAVTQNFGNLNFNGVQDPQAFAQIIEKLQGQEVIYSQRGALFNN